MLSQLSVWMIQFLSFLLWFLLENDFSKHMEPKKPNYTKISKRYFNLEKIKSKRPYRKLWAICSF